MYYICAMFRSQAHCKVLGLAYQCNKRGFHELNCKVDRMLQGPAYREEDPPL